MADQNVNRKFAAILTTEVAGIDGHGTLTDWLARMVAR